MRESELKSESKSPSKSTAKHFRREFPSCDLISNIIRLKTRKSWTGRNSNEKSKTKKIVSSHFFYLGSSYASSKESFARRSLSFAKYLSKIFGYLGELKPKREFRRENAYTYPKYFLIFSSVIIGPRMNKHMKSSQKFFCRENGFWSKRVN